MRHHLHSAVKDTFKAHLTTSRLLLTQRKVHRVCREGWHWRAKGKGWGAGRRVMSGNDIGIPLKSFGNGLLSTQQFLLNRTAHNAARPKGLFVNEEANVRMC